MRTRGSIKDLLITAVIAIAGFALLSPLSDLALSKKPQLPAGYSDSDLFIKGGDLKGFLFGTESLAADWYWMRALQYIGEKIVNSGEDLRLDDLRALNPRLLYPMLDNATDLDPHFLAPYTYGAMVLPAIDTEQAIKITKKGIGNNPNAWRLYQHLGYIYWHSKRYEEAAEAYAQGAEIAGAAQFMRLMAASMRSEGGSRTTARAIYQEMYANAQDDGIRTTAERRLQELEWFDERDAIDEALTQSKERAGQCPEQLREIMPALERTRLPAGDFRLSSSGELVDPTGAPYLLDRTECKVQIDRKTSHLPLETK